MSGLLRLLAVRRYSQAKTRVGFIGLGNMGLPMARNLRGRGEFVLCVYDSHPERLPSDMAAVASLGQLAAECPQIVTMLPSEDAVRQVYLSPTGLLGLCPPKTTLIDCSTVSPALEKEIFRAATGRNIDFLDAPVSGGTKGAQQGTLSFLVGGDAAIMEKQRDLFMAMGSRLFYCGAAGSGQAAKICNNLILGVSMVVLSESLALGIKLGLDAKAFSHIINSCSGRSWASELYNPVPGVMETAPASLGYRGGFATKLMLKDMRLALEEARRWGASLPTGSAALEAYSQLEDGDLDFSSIFQLLSRSKQQ